MIEGRAEGSCCTPGVGSRGLIDIVERGESPVRGSMFAMGDAS
jgi:hypothetical protein